MTFAAFSSLPWFTVPLNELGPVHVVRVISRASCECNTIERQHAVVVVFTVVDASKIQTAGSACWWKKRSKFSATSESPSLACCSLFRRTWMSRNCTSRQFTSSSPYLPSLEVDLNIWQNTQDAFILYILVRIIRCRMSIKGPFIYSWMSCIRLQWHHAITSIT